MINNLQEYVQHTKLQEKLTCTHHYNVHCGPWAYAQEVGSTAYLSSSSLHIPHVVGVGFMNSGFPCNTVWIPNSQQEMYKNFTVGFHTPSTNPLFPGHESRNCGLGMHGLSYEQMEGSKAHLCNGKNVFYAALSDSLIQPKQEQKTHPTELWKESIYIQVPWIRIRYIKSIKTYRNATWSSTQK